MIRAAVLFFLAIALGACGDDGGASADPDAASPGSDATAVDPTEPIFDPEHLLVVDIDMAPADWDALRFEHSDFLAATGTGCQDGPPPKQYNFYPATVTIDGEQIANVGVRKKGFLGSVTPVRPSLKIKFDQYDPAQRFAGMRRLTLNNNHQDDSQIDTCLTYGVFRAAGVPAPRCNFARVRVNGQELGIYSNVESIKKPLLRRWFTDDSGNLYEGVLSDFRDGWTGTFELKTNELTPDLSDLETVAPVLALPDDQVLAALDQIVDVDALLTFWAAESLVNHWDGYAGNTNNFFVYHDPTSDKFQFIPWGADATFGVRNPFPPLDRPASVHAVSALPRRLYLLPESRDLYRARMQQLLDDVWDETALLAEIDRIEALIGDDVYGPADRFQAGLSRVRSFVQSRRGAVQAELDGPAPDWPHPLRGDPCLQKVGEASGTFDTTWEDPFPRAFPLGVGSGTFAITLDGVTPTVNSVGYNAGPADIGGERQGIMILGVRADNGHGIGVYLGVEPELYQPGPNIPVDMYTTFAFALEGPLSSNMPLRGFAFGTLDLGEAGAAPGEPVSGSFSIELWGQPGM